MEELTLTKVSAECPHCRHQIEGVARFGLDIIRCTSCAKFAKVESRVLVTRVVARRTMQDIDTTDAVQEV